MKSSEWAVLLIVGIFLFISGIGIGIDITQNTAVKNGHAYYDPITKDFKWGTLNVPNSK